MSDEIPPRSSGPGRPERLDELLRPAPRPHLRDRLTRDRLTRDRPTHDRPSVGRPRLAGSRWLAVGVIGLVVVIGGGWWWRSPRSGAAFDLANLPRATTAPAGGGTAAGSDVGSTTVSPEGPTSATSALTVDVAGAVVAPGVRNLPPGSRVGDAIAAAGGVRPDADLDRVNRAAGLTDGARVWIPIRDQPDPSPIAVETPAGPSTGSGAATPSAPIDLNSATVDQLDTLPGVGPATAGAIVAHRSAHGPFSSVDELGDVRGIGPAKLETLRPLVRVGG